MEDYSALKARLSALPQDRKDVLVVRSHPFGDIIEADTRKVHGHVSRPDSTDPNAWSELAYGIVRDLK